MKQLAVLAIMWLTAIVAHAQDEPEYRLELGAGAALAAYQGDFNGSLLKSMKPMGGVVAKYKPNPPHGMVGTAGLHEAERNIGQCQDMVS